MRATDRIRNMYRALRWHRKGRADGIAYMPSVAESEYGLPSAPRNLEPRSDAVRRTKLPIM